MSSLVSESAASNCSMKTSYESNNQPLLSILRSRSLNQKGALSECVPVGGRSEEGLGGLVDVKHQRDSCPGKEAFLFNFRPFSKRDHSLPSWNQPGDTGPSCLRLRVPVAVFVHFRLGAVDFTCSSDHILQATRVVAARHTFCCSSKCQSDRPGGLTRRFELFIRQQGNKWASPRIELADIF